MRFDPRTIDAGARDAVTALNQIWGVTTRASCEGVGSPSIRHRHADLAYVLFQYPLPLRLQEFLNGELGAVARIDDDALYSRWPARNQEFLERLLAAARRYANWQATDRAHHKRWPLAKLRTHCARHLIRGERAEIALCCDCPALVSAPHSEGHRVVGLVQVEPDQEVRWFAEFAAQPGNGLHADLIAADGWSRLLARARRAEFGEAFHRRWLRYRAGRLAGLTTRQIRAAVADARRRGMALDFFHDATHVVFTWDD